MLGGAPYIPAIMSESCYLSDVESLLTRRLHVVRIRHWMHVWSRHKRGSLALHDHRWLAMGLNLMIHSKFNGSQEASVDGIDVLGRHKDTAVDNT